MLKRAALLLVCSGITFLAFGQSRTSRQKKEKPIVVFSVAGDVVTADEFVYLYNKNHQNKDQDFTEQKIQEYLTLFINFKLKVHEAKRRGMDTTAAFVKEYNSYRDELRKPYLPDAKLTDSLMRLTYERLKEEVKASHILVAVKPEASPEDTLKAYTKIMDIRNKILQEEDFAKAATTYSDDESAKINQGSLGYFTSLQMVYPFETAAYETPVGQVSQPVKTRYGYHILKVFDRRPARGEVEVSHIMVRAGDQKDPEKAKNTIFAVYEQLQAGVKWEDLCKEYSEDPATKDSGGRLRPFGTGGMASVPEFEKTAFQLEKSGEISDPFQSQYGWHIMRLEKKIPLQSFDVMQGSLKSRVTRDERTELSKQALQAKLRKEYQFSENAMTKKNVLALADSSLQRGSWKPPVSPSPDKQILFSVQGTGYSVNEFFKYVQKNQKANTHPPAKILEQLYNNYTDAIIFQKVEEQIIRTNPTYRYLLKEYYEGILLFEIMEKEVWNKAAEDSLGQKTYYKNHTTDYQAGERAKTIIYSSNSKDIVAQLKSMVAAGDDEKANDFVSLKKVKVESGYFKKEDKAVLQKVAWEKGLYSVENNGMYYLAWLKDILPPGPMSFEEARPAIISDYQAFLEKVWLEQLKKRYSVKVNEKGKQYILQQLQSK
ncbi:MAG TPA: peptidylprolyl isomerase [Chryseolinea sp.]|nr:peptidylprolyl isomerase [Chryseolinea sp.]